MNIDDTLSKAVEDARISVAQAQNAFNDAHARTEHFRGRIEAVRARQAEITAKRLEGVVNDLETAEIAALGHDLSALLEMLDEAETAAKALEAELNDARSLLLTRETAWARHESEVLVAGLRERALMLEARLTECLAELSRQALQAGHGILPEVWVPSDRLKEFTSRSDLAALARR